MQRLQALREKALAATHSADKFYYYFYKHYCQDSNYNEFNRYAEAFYSAFSEMPPIIEDGELIVGRYNVDLTETEAAEWISTYKPLADSRKSVAGNGQDSHMAIDYELLLSKGILGIIETIDSLLENCDADKVDFYNCCKRCLQAVVKHSESYSEAAMLLSRQTTDSLRQAELKKIAQICKKVPLYPAETFYEAVQSVNFISYCLSLNPFRMCYQQFQLGHPDRYLLPFYERDMKNGIITQNEAQLLLDCLGIQINMRVPNGLSCGYMVGGRDGSGNIVANEITDMALQVIDDVRLVYPAVGLCHTEDMPEEYLKKACELLCKGYSHPAIFNDDIITKGLIYYGVPEKEAHNYIHSTCVEITPVGSSNVWVASPYTNLPKLLLDIMDREYSSLDDLLETYFEKLSQSIAKNFENENNSRIIRAQNSINPLLSCFVNDCLERGLDIEQGGAKYNWIMPSFVGMANLVDSLYSIKTLVFDQHKMSIKEFKTVLDSNFKDDEALRLWILNNIPKYGNDIDEVDCYFEKIADFITNECQKYVGIHSNAALIPSVFCWVMHERFGRQTHATPDGRKAGFPLGDGSGPCQGRELNGPTASVLSSTKWDHSKFIGGVAVNLKFSKASLGEGSLDNMRSIIKTFLLRGGFETQINVTDRETLKKAQASPEEYRDLVVRIGGYSDYFVTLSPQMQEEVILRTEHNV